MALAGWEWFLFEEEIVIPEVPSLPGGARWAEVKGLPQFEDPEEELAALLAFDLI